MIRARDILSAFMAYAQDAAPEYPDPIPLPDPAPEAPDPVATVERTPAPAMSPDLPSVVVAMRHGAALHLGPRVYGVPVEGHRTFEALLAHLTAEDDGRECPRCHS